MKIFKEINKKTIGVWISHVRKKVLHMTQEDFAELVGKKVTDISKYERGINMAPGDVILKIQKEDSYKLD